jgi:hypothetical protein
LDNYRELLGDPLFYAALRHNAVVIAFSALFQLPLGMALALVVTSSLRWVRLWRAVYFLPMLMSTVAIGILWGYILNPTYGLLNGALGAVGLDGLQQPWLGQSSTALSAVMMTTVWQFAPFYMIVYSAAIVGSAAGRVRGGPAGRRRTGPAVLLHHPAAAQTGHHHHPAAVGGRQHQVLRPGLRDDRRRTQRLHRAAGHLHVPARAS